MWNRTEWFIFLGLVPVEEYPWSGGESGHIDANEGPKVISVLTGRAFFYAPRTPPYTRIPWPGSRHGRRARGKRAAVSGLG